jgi:signal transduction histidine kinase
LSAQRGIRLSVVREGPGPFLVAASGEDIDRLSGVLVDNAVKHAGAGGCVEVRVRGAGSRVVLEVDDTGPGIPEDQVPFIFDRFHRSSADSDGTGLGLAIADAVVRTSRGSWVVQRSTLGGARMGVSWKRAGPRRVGGTEAEIEAFGTAPARDGDHGGVSRR